MKKVIVSLLVVALVIGCFAGCGKKEKGDLQQQAVSRDYVYKQEVISYNGSGTAPSGLIQIGDKVYGYSYEWREMDGAVTPRADIEGGGNRSRSRGCRYGNRRDCGRTGAQYGGCSRGHCGKLFFHDFL